ncbi:unnamed protein product [Sphacelaria rigidula]
MDSKSFRIHHSETRKVRESRNVVSPRHLLGFDEGTFSYDEHEDLVRAVRNYTLSLDLSSPSEKRVTEDVPVNQILDLIKEITSRDLLAAPEHSASPEPSPVEESVPSGVHNRTRGQTNQRVPSERNQRVPTSRTVRELGKLPYFAKGEFPDVADSHEQLSLVEYAYAATNTQLRSGTIKIPTNFEEAIMLPKSTTWKEAAQKQLKSLQDLKVYSLVPKTDVPLGLKIIGSEWVLKVKPVKTCKARLVA